MHPDKNHSPLKTFSHNHVYWNIIKVIILLAKPDLKIQTIKNLTSLSHCGKHKSVAVFTHTDSPNTSCPISSNNPLWITSSDSNSIPMLICDSFSYLFWWFLQLIRKYCTFLLYVKITITVSKVTIYGFTFDKYSW